MDLAHAPAPAGEDSLLSPAMVGRLGRLALAARRFANLRRAGRRRTRRIGSGVETIDLRGYCPGDDTRRIAWHAYARLERLLVRLVADEAPLRLTLVVDESASMGFGAPTKLRHASRVAAGFAAVALGGEDRVGLAVGSGRDGARVYPPVTGKGGLVRILRTLDGLAPAARPTDLAEVVRAVLDGSRRGPGLTLLFTDLLEEAGVLAGAREARRQGQDVAVVEVLTPFELDPPDLSGCDLEDEETGELIELPDADVVARYAAALAARRRAVDAEASALGAVIVRTTTDEPFEAIVTRALTAGLLGAGR